MLPLILPENYESPIDLMESQRAIKKIKDYSEIATEEKDLTIKDKIVTLSTCTGNESTRFVVQGKRVSASDIKK